MLFAVLYTSRAHGDEARDRRTNQMLAAWKPPAGSDFKAWYDFADGSGGVALIETSSAEVMLEAIAPWMTFIDFSIKPVVSVEASTPIFAKAAAWRDSLK